MSINEFAEVLKTKLLERMEEVQEIEIKRVLKNNSVALLGLLFTDSRRNVSPTIYLENFYKLYQEGTELEDIVDEICRCYEESQMPENKDVSFIRDWEQVKGMVAYKLVSRERNQELLEKIPHKDILDLSIIFYLAVEQYGGSILIYNSHCEMWNVDVEELAKVAVENTPRICPWHLQTMGETLGELGMEMEEAERLYVLSNEKRLFGAVALLYPGSMERVAERLQSDFYIIPSSIHETIIVPTGENMDANSLIQMVHEVNSTVMVEEEILGDNVYFYSREKQELEVA